METTHPFSFRGREGNATVRYRQNEDPERWGYGLLELPWPSTLAMGLPVLEIDVSTALEGYGAVMGWIQVVRIQVAESSTSLVPGNGRRSRKSHLGQRTAPAQRARRAVCVIWTLPDPVRRSCIGGERHPLRRRLLSNGQPRCIDQSAFARLLRRALGLLDEAGTDARASSANSAWPQRLGAGHTRPPRTLPRLDLEADWLS